jgi:peptidoglycan/LPS O-acetylase OafA/YrhL
VAVAWNTWHDRSLLTEANALLLAAAAQVVNIATSFADPSITTSTHLWSLSIEWQFYLLLPLLLMPLWRRPGDTRSRLGLVLGVALASMLLRPALGAADVVPWQIYHWTITRLDGLALGVAAGLLLERPSRAARRWSASVALLAIAVAIVATPDWWRDPRLSLYVSITAVGMASYVLVRGITTGRAAVPLVGVLASRPLRWIGERSYSIYLWHFFIGVVVIADGSEDWQGLPVFAAQMAASLAVAVAAYEFVEKPCRARYTLQAKVTSGDASPITAG